MMKNRRNTRHPSGLLLNLQNFASLTDRSTARYMKIQSNRETNLQSAVFNHPVKKIHRQADKQAEIDRKVDWGTRKKTEESQSVKTTDTLTFRQADWPEDLPKRNFYMSLIKKYSSFFRAHSWKRFYTWYTFLDQWRYLECSLRSTPKQLELK